MISTLPNTMIRTLTVALGCFVMAACLAAPAVAAAASVPGELIVGYEAGTSSMEQDRIATAAGATPEEQVAPNSQVVQIRPGESRADAAARLRATRGVAYVVGNRIARAAGAPTWMPNDIGRTGRAAGGWLTSQWNFSSSSGVSATSAWANVARAGRPGGSGVIIAVIDSGVAYTNWGQFKRSPDFANTRFAHPYDFVAHNRYPLDRNGHGTHVAGTIAESTNNQIFMTGLAWGATIIPLRVLDALGNGDSAAIARAIRYAVHPCKSSESCRGAQVINLSIEFDTETTARDIPDVVSAINYANSKGVLVVAAAGNDANNSVSYPARTAAAMAVGAVTEHGCLADYSNHGAGLDIVAPGGGGDRAIDGDPNCRPNDPPGRDIVQLGLAGTPRGSALIPYRFELDAEDGTSMATPHVSAAAALVIASGAAGRNPTPAQIRAKLEASATRRSQSTYYGAGIVNAGRATEATPAG